MWSPRRRTWAVFRLAWSYWRDARQIARNKRITDVALRNQKEREIYRAGGERFRVEALRLGGLIIKVGQFLSARTDVLPLDFTRELQALQDRVPAASFSEISAMMDTAYGKPWTSVFSEFEPEPLAAASLGQVHRARLADSGRWVAVKVQRPGIDQLAAVDLRALGTVMRVISRWTKVGRRINAERLFAEFRSLVGEELDYLHEQENLQEFHRNFASDAQIRVPEPCPEYTRTQVLVMELVEGAKLTDPVQLAEYGADPRALAKLLIAAYLKQIITDGLVQIDPHPGNFFADADGRLVLLDFGMCARIPAQHMPYAGQMIRAVLNKDARLVVEAMAGLGFIRPEADVRLLVRSMAVLLQQLGGVALESGPQLDQAVADFQEFLYQEPLEFPAEYMFLGRAIGMLFGLVSGLDSDIEWLQILQQEALPLISAQAAKNPRWMDRLFEMAGSVLGSGPQAVLQMGTARVVEEIQRVAQLPARMDRVLDRIEDRGLPTDPTWGPMLRRMDVLNAEIRLLTHSVLLAASLILWTMAIVGPLEQWLLAAATGILALLWIRAALSLRWKVRRGLGPRLHSHRP